ncbi:MAG: cytochrome oxidase subunit III [Saprospiraceae bacterium]|nr:MAG: cytochrome oxidase subunit III [Saprospiraceae bacterium]
MASEAAVLEHTTEQDEQLWEGGKSPFKASYGKLMMWYFLLSDAFTFAGFLISYGALRFSSPTWPLADFVFEKVPFFEHAKAPLVFVTFMTFVLIASSVTMVRAVQEGHRENKDGAVKWLIFTIIGGLIFLSSQAWEWTTLIAKEGVTIHTNPFSRHTEAGTYLSGQELEALGFSKVEKEIHGVKSTYYLPPNAADIEENRYFEKIDHFGKSFAGESFKVQTPYLITINHDTHQYEPGAYKTEGGEIKKEEFGPVAFGALFFFITGFHGFHVFSGVVFLTIVAINTASGIYLRRRNGHEMVEKIGLYWHFVDLVWVFVFLVFYLL